MNKRKFECLFTPLKIRGMVLKNRIVMTPVQVNFSTNGMSNQKRYNDFFALRAKSGAALMARF